MADLLHYDSGSGYAVETETSPVPAVRVAHLDELPDPAGALAPLRHAQARWLDQLPFELRWTQAVDRGALSYASVKNTRVRAATFGLGALTATGVTLSWTPPAAGGRSDTPPSDLADLDGLYTSGGGYDLHYGPRSSSAWRPRRVALSVVTTVLTDFAAGDVLLVTRRGVWEFCVRLT